MTHPPAAPPSQGGEITAPPLQGGEIAASSPAVERSGTPPSVERAGAPLAVEWAGGADGCLRLIDQTLLPARLERIDCHDVDTVHEAIRSLRVRGAPAIGIAAAYGLVLGIRPAASQDAAGLRQRIGQVADHLRTSRPTAINLFWALGRMERKADELLARGAGPAALVESLLAEAIRIHEEDRRMCAEIGRHGAQLLADGWGVLTHCNAGALATGGQGTALSVLYHAHESGKRLTVYVDETRPLLQGSRLTAWELLQRGLAAVLLCDSMAAVVMREKRVQAVIVGADRIAANGDVANKIGTYALGVLARAHGIPFYVAAPSSTFDLSLASGSQIPIEHRSPAEITQGLGRPTAPEGIAVFNPAFDITPGELITAFITEAGIIQPPYVEHLAAAPTASERAP